MRMKGTTTLVTGGMSMVRRGLTLRFHEPDDTATVAGRRSARRMGKR